MNDSKMPTAAVGELVQPKTPPIEPEEGEERFRSNSTELEVRHIDHFSIEFDPTLLENNPEEILRRFLAHVMQQEFKMRPGENLSLNFTATIVGVRQEYRVRPGRGLKYKVSLWGARERNQIAYKRQLAYEEMLGTPQS